jgi:hypothetical protein
MYVLHLIKSVKTSLQIDIFELTCVHREYKESVCDMILPVNALTPKVLFRGDESREAAKMQTKKRVALFNAAGISAILGAATTAIARSNTSSWRHAGYFGIGASLISMMFLAPGFLYKAGVGVKKSVSQDKDVFAKEIEMPKKFGDISTTAKSTTKATIKSLPKI